MKRWLRAICIIISVLCLVGCGMGNKEGDGSLKWTTDASDNRALSTDAIEKASAVTAETVEDRFKYRSDIRYVERGRHVSLSEEGIIYANDDKRLHLVAKDTGEDSVFCYNLGCKHPNYPVSYGTPECMSVLYKNATQTAYYNKTVYFFVNGDAGNEHRIYEMDMETQVRRGLAKLPVDYFYFSPIIFKEDLVYYIGRTTYTDEVTGEIIEKLRMLEVSLRDGSYRFVTEETENLITHVVHVTGKTLWMRMADNSDKGRVFMETVDLDTLEVSTVIDKDEWALGNHFIDAYDDDSYYYWDANTYKIGIKNVDGTVEKILLQGAEGETFGDVDISGGKMLYFRGSSYGGEAAGAYFMDVETGNVINITEEVDKYNITGYDSSYDVFISCDEEFNYSMWSREKILAEAAK